MFLPRGDVSKHLAPKPYQILLCQPTPQLDANLELADALIAAARTARGRAANPLRNGLVLAQEQKWVHTCISGCAARGGDAGSTGMYGLARADDPGAGAADGWVQCRWGRAATAGRRMFGGTVHLVVGLLMIGRRCWCNSHEECFAVGDHGVAWAAAVRRTLSCLPYAPNLQVLAADGRGY